MRQSNLPPGTTDEMIEATNTPDEPTADADLDLAVGAWLKAHGETLAPLSDLFTGRKRFMMRTIAVEVTALEHGLLTVSECNDRARARYAGQPVTPVWEMFAVEEPVCDLAFADGDSIESAPGVTIEPGDFVRSTLVGGVCGFIVDAITIHAGKDKALPGYLVEMADGRKEFIGADDIELVSMSKEHLMRVTAYEYRMETHSANIDVEPFDPDGVYQPAPDDDRDYSEFYENANDDHEDEVYGEETDDFAHAADLAYPATDTLTAAAPYVPTPVEYRLLARLAGKQKDADASAADYDALLKAGLIVIAGTRIDVTEAGQDALTFSYGGYEVVARKVGWYLDPSPFYGDRTWRAWVEDAEGRFADWAALDELLATKEAATAETVTA